MQSFALLPAAGKSNRMGRPKLLLPLGGRTVLEWAIDALRLGGLDRVLVVVAPHVAELAALAHAAGAEVLVLPDETPDMRATVTLGLAHLERRYAPQPDDRWFLMPADHPALDAAVVRQLIETGGSRANPSIIIPTFQGTRGHPVGISWKHVAGIRASPAGQGINVYLRQQRAETLEVPVESASVLIDLDTPDDYRRLAAAWGENGAIPGH
ncbi:MAG: nucleotidyltransferase family protein [Gemmataceae bacterium]|nr:nucleotidyltransferase family protein [Gemmataceae bacterium]